MNIQAFRDNIIIEPLPQEEKIGSLLVPFHVDNIKKGKVVSTGNGRKTEHTTIQVSVKENDIVAYIPTKTKIAVDGSTYDVVKDSELLAIVE
ncbi:MAG: hypothetical protein WC284_17945 [Candidimonas sp.]